MELRQLNYFIRVARRQHVTKAAEELHVAQSAVSRQIHLLENELGIALFIQKGRNLQLTPEGSLFLKRAESIVLELERAVQEIKDMAEPESGYIRIGFPHSFGVHMVPSVVSKFRKFYPNAKFRLHQGTYASLLNDVQEGTVDLALISPIPEPSEQITGDLLKNEELFVVLPPNHRFANERELALHQLKDESFVLFSEGYSLRPIVWEACLNAGFVPDISFEGEETDTIRGLVAAGMGVSLLPEMALQTTSELQPVRIPIVGKKVTRSIGVIYNRKVKLPTLAETFRNFILNELKH